MLKDEQLKDSTLQDDAAIYTARVKKTEKQKLSEMNFKEKVEYLKNYYLAKTAIILITLFFIVYLAYSILSPKSETVLYGAIINYALSEDKATAVQTDFSKYLNLDEKKHNILLDTTFYLGNNQDTSQYTMSSQQKLSTYIFAGEIDFIIAPESVMNNYASIGYLDKLTNILPTNLNSELKDSMYYSTTEDDPVTSAYGVYIDNSSIYEKVGNNTDRPVLAVLANSNYKDNAVEFIGYIFHMGDKK